MNLKLNKRNEEIASSIPKGIRSIVLNAVLAKACESGILEQELSYHLPSYELQEILSVLFPYKTSDIQSSKKRGRPKGSKTAIAKRIEKKMKEENKSDNGDENIFVGFDD